MSSTARSNMPAFGVSRSGQSVNNEPRSIPDVVENTVKIPILDLQNRAQSGQSQIGELVLNQQDSLMYYYTGHQWIPLAVMDMETHQITELLSQLINLENNRNVIIEAPNSGNIRLVAGTNSQGVGGHIHISAGQGGLADGEIYYDVGGDRALTIKKTSDVSVNSGNLHVDNGDLVVKSGNLELEDPAACINCNVARAEITAVTVQNRQPQTSLEADDGVPPPSPTERGKASRVDTDVQDDAVDTDDPIVTLPEATLNGMNGILTVNLELKEDESLSGQVRNGLLQEDSWVGITVVNSGSGVPYAWIDAPQDGSVRYHIRCLNGELSRVQLHIDVRNSL